MIGHEFLYSSNREKELEHRAKQEVFLPSCRPVNSNLDDEVLMSDLVPINPVL